MEREPVLSRRGLLRTALGTTAVAAGTAAAAGGATAATRDFGGWLTGTSNYDGVVDRTGRDTVTVEVGVPANGGNFGFGPPAVHVSPGTTVRWEWTGKGGQHTVTAQTGGDFDSGLQKEQGHTFEQTFEEPAVVEYFCTPHASLGMKGVVVVGDATLGPSGAAGGSDGSAGGGSAATGGGGGGGGGGDGSPSGTGGYAGGLGARFGAVGGAAIGFMVFLVAAMVGIAVHSIRNDQHSPGAAREE